MANMSLLNFTGHYTDINSHRGNIGKHDLPVFTMNGKHHVFLKIGLAIVVAFILCLYLAKLAMWLRRRYARPTAGQAGRAWAQIIYARSASPTVTLNIPPALPPPNPNRQNDPQDDDLTEPKDHRPRGLNSPSPVSQMSFIEDCSGCPDREPIIDPRNFVGHESHPPQSHPPKPARMQTTQEKCSSNLTSTHLHIVALPLIDTINQVPKISTVITFVASSAREYYWLANLRIS